MLHNMKAHNLTPQALALLKAIVSAKKNAMFHPSLKKGKSGYDFANNKTLNALITQEDDLEDDFKSLIAAGFIEPIKGDWYRHTAAAEQFLETL
jgi:hypothetical protein